MNPMSDRHTHITQFLYDEPDKVARFIEALRERFEHVTPIVREGDDRPRAVAFMTSDTGDGESWIYTLPDAIEVLEGILESDVEIVSAWDGRPWGCEPQRVWLVRGSRTLANEKTVVIERTQL
jgi:hypothetical protein